MLLSISHVLSNELTRTGLACEEEARKSSTPMQTLQFDHCLECNIT